MTKQFLTGQALTLAYKEGSLTPLQVCTQLWQRLKQYNPEVNAFSYLAEEESLEMAKASTLRWQQGKALSPIDGWPISIKDSLEVRTWPMHAGASIRTEASSKADAPVVHHLRLAGAVLFAKTTMPQWGWKGATDSPVTGITRNPWDVNKTCGGSSGGAAVAVALGLGVAAIGTDGGGSIRIPGAFCGVIGYKPTHDLFPLYPLHNLAQLVDVGVLAREIADIETLLPILNQEDKRAVNYVPLPSIQHKELYRLAYSSDFGFAELDPEVAIIFQRSIAVLREHRFVLEEKTPPVGKYLSAFAHIWQAGSYESYADLTAVEQRQLDPGFVRIAQLGETMTLLEYLQAESTRLSVSEAMQAFFNDYDALLTPTVPIPAFDIGLDSPHAKSVSALDNWTPFTCLFNMTGQPSITVPCGLTSQGLPVGLQISGPKLSDRPLLALSQKIAVILQFGALPPLINPV
ncbi:MAG: amidase [Gammaproteobacteria bacterium]|jgi:aspartyl-tRNA(Asn)/glutamyl-tRNA(Gln) amidotransferase subunit A|nr:amidase [Gammaproteobacteria bacterium]